MEEKQMKKIITSVVNYLNEVNHYQFSEEELIEGFEDLLLQIENKDVAPAVGVLQEEYECTGDKMALELINQLEKVSC